MRGLYKLEGKRAVLVKNLYKWAEWMETADMHVADEEVDGVRVSTVFLGIDHNHSGRHLGRNDPLLFETCVFFMDGNSTIIDRYFIWEEAEAGHNKTVALIKQQQDEIAKLTAGALKTIYEKAKA